MQKYKPHTQSSFRDDLKNVLPGYNWTVHKPHMVTETLVATGIQSSGFNRLSTIEVQSNKEGNWFKAKISGFGTKSPWTCECLGKTLKQVIRNLQEYLEHQERFYGSLAESVKNARINTNTKKNDT